MSKEKWIYLKGTNKLYKISSYGNIFSCKNNIVLSLKKQKSTYIKTQITINGVCKTRSIHRLVALHFIDNPKNYKVVHHKDHNKHNNHCNNLIWCTQSENIKHAITSGEMRLDSFRSAKSKINEEKMLTAFTMRNLYTQKQIREYLGIKQPNLWNLFNGKTYKAYTKNLV